MDKNAPVGVFDSGMGGLATLKALQKQLPHENFIFYGDNANAPYGTKQTEEIRERCFACTDFLLDKGCKTIVIACNTASSAAKEDLRKAYQVPFVAMEPAIARPGVPEKRHCAGDGNAGHAAPAAVSLSGKKMRAGRLCGGGALS
ncbi:MAG: glutamate racemase [Christensenellales bacterium]